MPIRVWWQNFSGGPKVENPHSNEGKWVQSLVGELRSLLPQGNLACQFSLVQSLSRVQRFATPWTAACQASLSITNSRSLPKPMSVELVMPSNHLILYFVPFSSCPQSFPASQAFQMRQLFSSGGQSIGVSASTSVLPMNTRDWFLYSAIIEPMQSGACAPQQEKPKHCNQKPHARYN